jgi:hypothetical protein
MRELREKVCFAPVGMGVIFWVRNVRACVSMFAREEEEAAKLRFNFISNFLYEIDFIGAAKKEEEEAASWEWDRNICVLRIADEPCSQHQQNTLERRLIICCEKNI